MNPGKTDKRILLLTDWVVKDNDWSFLREMKKLGYECETVGVEITRKYGNRLKKIIYLWGGYLLIGLKGFLRRKRFDFVIAYQGVAGLFYALFELAFGSKRPKLVLMAFFFKKRQNALYNYLRYLFTRLALKGVYKVVCYSSSEAKYYNTLFKFEDRKFVFVPFGVNLTRLDSLLSWETSDNGYIFSAGSSNRDYQTFFESVAELDVRVVVFAKKYNVAGIRIPANVEMIYDVYGDEFYRRLLGAKLVVVPLADPELSSGQMVLLESMGLGKPVIISRVWGTTDYVSDGEDALLVDVRDEHGMRKAIASLLQSEDKTSQLGKNARTSVQKKFGVASMAEGVTAVLN